MHRKWREGDLDAAASLARAAAPYLHPRRAVLRDAPPGELHRMSDAELSALLDGHDDSAEGGGTDDAEHQSGGGEG